METPTAISLVKAVIHLTARGHRAATALDPLPPAYPSATPLLSSLSALATALAAALESLHALLLRSNAEAVLAAHLLAAPALRAALDAGLDGCAVAFACVEVEAGRMAAAAAGAGAGAGAEAPGKRRLRVRMPWREEGMKAMAGQLRGLVSVVKVLGQALVMREGNGVQELVGGCEAVVARVVLGTRALRAAHPGVKGVDVGGVEEEGADGRWEWDFNGVVARSTAYRQARAAVTKREEVVQPGAGTPAQEAPEGVGDVESPQVVEQEQPSSNAGQGEPAAEDRPESSTEKQGDTNAGNPVETVNVGAAETPVKQLSPEQDANEEKEEAPSLPARPVQEQAAEQGTGQEEEEEAPPLPPRRQPSESQAKPPSPISNDADNAAGPSTDGAQFAETKGTSPLPSPIPSPPLTPLELSIHHTWQTLLLTELTHISALISLHTTLSSPALHAGYPRFAQHLAPILPPLSALIDAHARHCLRPLHLQLASVAKTDLLLPVFRAWCRRAAAPLQAFCQRLPHAVAVVRAAEEGEKGFRESLVGVDAGHGGEGVEGVVRGLETPQRRLAVYCEVLDGLAVLEGGEGAGGARPTTQAREYRSMLVSLTEACKRVVAEAENKEELRNIQRRIETINFHHVEGLDLMGAGRRIVHQGSLACKVKGKGLWNQVHCVLLDNYMFWGRIERPRESWFGKYKYGEKLWVLEAPLLSDQLQCEVQDGRTKSSIIDNVPRATELFVFTVKAGDVKHLFAAVTEEERREWINAVESTPR